MIREFLDFSMSKATEVPMCTWLVRWGVDWVEEDASITKEPQPPPVRLVRPTYYLAQLAGHIPFSHTFTWITIISSSTPLSIGVRALVHRRSLHLMPVCGR